MNHSSHVAAPRRLLVSAPRRLLLSAPHGLLFALLLGASLGCLSLEPLSSYSSGGPALQRPASVEPLAPSEPEPEATPAEPEGEAEGQMPVSEGVPGEGDIALEPVTPPDPAETPASDPEAMASCAGVGEFSSADGQTCYVAATQSASWTDAFAACQMWGGGLVIIDSQEEDELLGQHIAATSWTGASDLVQEGRMLWIGGAPVIFSNWAMGQPDDFQGREDCVVKTMPAGSWNDVPCRNLNAYVCERREN